MAFIVVIAVLGAVISRHNRSRICVLPANDPIKR